MKTHLVSLSIFCLGICFVIGSWLISNSLHDVKITQTTGKSIQVKEIEHQLLTKSELADYLGISTEEVQKLSSTPGDDDVFFSKLPQITIGETDYYPKMGVDKWLQNMELLGLP